MFVPKGADTVKVYEQKNAIQKDHTRNILYYPPILRIKNEKFHSRAGWIFLLAVQEPSGKLYVLPEQIELGIINQALMRMDNFCADRLGLLSPVFRLCPKTDGKREQ